MSGTLKNRTLLFADFSTARYEAQTQGMDMVDAQDIILTAAVKKHKGSIVSSADVLWQAVFEEPLKAVECALAVQGRLAEHNRGCEPAKRISSRIALHEGSVDVCENAVNGADADILKNLLQATPSGRIFASGQVYSAALGQIPCAFIPLGAGRFTDSPETFKVYEVIPALGVDPDATLPDRRATEPPPQGDSHGG